MEYKKILIAVDSSPFSLKAAQAGFALAHAADAEVALIFVVDKHKESVTIEAGTTTEQSEIILLKEAQETIDQLVKMYNGAKQLYKFTPEGFPKEAILGTAKEWEADVIVIGSTHKSGLSHLFSSSTAEHVIKHACVPVLVIPPAMK